MDRLAAYFKAKYAVVNQLPEPQLEELQEEPSTSEVEDPPFPETDYVGYTGESGVRPSEGPRKPSPYDKVRGPADTSLGVPIAADRAQRWKDRMVLAYDRIKKELTTLPFFQEIYAEMAKPFHKTEPMLKVFNDLINSYVVNVAGANLEEAFLFGVKYVAAFNDLRDMLPRMVKDRERGSKLWHAIWSTQNFIWKRVKDLLNIHDIGSGEIGLSPGEAAEMHKILKRLPRGTWTYGPMANPTKPLYPNPFEKRNTNDRKNERAEYKRIMEGK